MHVQSPLELYIDKNVPARDLSVLRCVTSMVALKETLARLDYYSYCANKATLTKHAEWRLRKKGLSGPQCRTEKLSQIRKKD